MGGTSFLSVLRQLAEADPGRPALTCAETQINIKAKYGLGVTAAERTAMIRVLKTGK